VEDLLFEALPWSVCEAVTAGIWSYARKVVAEGAVVPSIGKQLHTCADRVASEQETADGGAPSTKKRKCQQSADTVIFGSSTFSQPTQLTQSTPAEADGSAVEAHCILRAAWEAAGRNASDLPAESFRAVRKMQQSAEIYWREMSKDLSKAATSVARFLEQQRRLYWRRPAWRGVNIGGWLLLEPGPSGDIFEKYGPASCEWDLMSNMRMQLGDEGADQAIHQHRENYFTEEDFRCIRNLGLNAVRIPFGYWIVTTPAEGEPYVGSGLEHLDRALAWCKSYGLQAVLDLHGAPGGESGEKPCGRESKDWHWQQWRFDESVNALRIVATRYKGHPAVSGISVCNEPSETIPAAALCKFYDNAVRVIREAGMPPDQVAIILPVYRTERLDEIWQLWTREFDGFVRHANTAFDLHLYHCFGTWWQRQSLGQQLRMTHRHRKILRRVPAVVGEWSLALSHHARGDVEEFEEDQALMAFASAQLEAYNQASHGWFFWTWKDINKQQPGWDMRKCIAQRWLPKAQLLPNSCGLKAAGGC
jgi:glucan 1,3-beta-glucosidase